MGDPFSEPDGGDPMLYLEAAKRKAILDAATARDRGPFNPETLPPNHTPSDQGSGFLALLSRFLKPGQQVTPATSRRNTQGIEDEIK